jgi:periplasmic copper chaperone A
VTHRRKLLALGLALGLAMVGHAAQADNDIHIAKAWARATPPAAKTGAIYLTITNTGSAPDTIEGASSPAADKVELHEMKMENGVMRMRPVPSLTIAPGQSVVLKPNGYHLMLIGLKAPLTEGQKVPVTVTFERAGAQQAMASVAKVGAMHAGEKGATSSDGSDMSTMPGMQH